jgi:adenylosuccinate synthase
MSATCVVGLQWGDEAKGKIVDLIGHRHHIVARYNGGANAGHTVMFGGRTFKLSLLPTGVLQPNLISIIGNGVVVYPPKFIDEVAMLQSSAVPVGDNLKLSNHAHLIFPYHMEEERLAESASDGSIGTTGRGIGPCYQDMVGRRYAIRVSDLMDEEHFRKRLAVVVSHKNRLISALGGPEAKTFDVDDLASEYLGYAKKLRPFVTDTVRFFHDAIAENKKILFEAAQGSLLDVNHGTVPFVTSSSSLPSGIWPGTGVPSKHLTKVIGVVKAYTTRVGRGPFPTELDDGPLGIGERIRKIGREYGTVTGRPRRCGWFDSVAVKYTSSLAGADEITVMLLDVLSGLPDLKIATAYELNGEQTCQFPSDSFILEKAKPVYETMPGWSADITGCRKLADLPANARRYVDRISELVNRPVSVISVGPDREQSIMV